MIHFHHQTTFSLILFGDFETFWQTTVFLQAQQIHEEPALANSVPRILISRSALQF